MKRLYVHFLVLIVVVVLMSFGCASILTKSSQLEYTIIHIPHMMVPDGIELKIPKGVPDFTKFDGFKLQPMSDVLLGLLYKDLETDNAYALVVERNGIRIFVLIDLNEKDAKYYIYPEVDSAPILVSSWEEVKEFLAEFDPEWKAMLEGMKDQKKEKKEKKG